MIPHPTFPAAGMQTAADSLALIAHLRTHNMATHPGAFMWGLLHITAIVVCVILFHRTASATLKSRFLRHIAHSYTVTGVYYCLKVALPFAQYALVGTALNPIPDSYQSLLFVEDELRSVDAVWPAVDSLLSIFSSYWLFTAYHLLWRYPQKESIDREFVALLYFLFGSIVGPILLGVLMKEGNQIYFTLVDTVTAGSAMALFGIAIARRLHPHSVHSQKHSRSVGILAAALFSAWGLAQPVYLIYRNESPEHIYFRVLLLLKFLCCIVTVAIASLTMKERPGFES
jgi:hypothetical protein